MWRGFCFFISFLFLCPAFANDCVKYKKTPNVKIENPEWKKTIKQSDKELDLALHGHVMARMMIGNSIQVETLFIKKGFCVSVTDINVIFGYDDFAVEIDKNYEPGSCAYNAVMEHEQKHIDVYLALIDEYKDDLEKAAQVAADSIMPEFVKTQSEIGTAIEKLNEKFQSHPEIVLIKQKIMAEQEIRNKKIDDQDDGAKLLECFK